MNKSISDKNLIVFGILGLYFINYQLLDFMFFSVFNGHLLFTPWIYKYIFALLNHRYENFFDIVLVLSILIWVLLRYSQHRKAALIFMLFAAIWYEVGFQLIHRLESLSWMAKHSPSLEYAVHVDLSKIHPLSKVYAQYSFPSGHALIFGYFGAIVKALFPSHLKKRFFKLSILCCIPRLVSGAHALSDMMAGYGLGIFLWKIFELGAKLLMKFQSYRAEPSFSKDSLESHFTY